MKRHLLTAMVIVIGMVTGACSSTFVAYKDGQGYYVGNGSDSAYKLFCESGDFTKILAGTQLSTDVKDSLYRYNCGAERSSEKIKQIYASMTPEQRKDLRKSFRDNGYEINYLHC